jgi:hypothetical protein
MFRYIKYTPVPDEYTTHQFNELNENCKVHRFDVPYVSVEYTDEADFTALMAAQNTAIEAIEITQEVFWDFVQHSAQVNRMYDVANDQYRKECEAITAKYTAEEIATWPTQVEEANAIKAGTATSTPYLTALAADEGITLVQAADKILGLKAANADYTAGCLIRKWQKLTELKSEVGL